MPKYVNKDKKEERLIKKVMKDSNVTKSQAIAILKDQGTLKQKKGKRELLVKKTAGKKKKK